MMSCSSARGGGGVLFVTAMAAVSGTAAVILFALKLQRSLPLKPPPEATATTNAEVEPQLQLSPPPPSLRPCISSAAGKSSNNGDHHHQKKKLKRVSFAKDVVEPSGNSDEFRRRKMNLSYNYGSSTNISTSIKRKRSFVKAGAGPSSIPANRVALYNGIMRDRLVHRMTCTY